MIVLFEMEVEDDLFFAELSEQIALLIMDEEEEFPLQCQPLPVQVFYLLAITDHFLF